MAINPEKIKKADFNWSEEETVLSNLVKEDVQIHENLTKFLSDLKTYKTVEEPRQLKQLQDFKLGMAEFT